MTIQGFTAEAALGSTTQKYRGRSHYQYLSVETIFPHQFDNLEQADVEDFDEEEMIEDMDMEA